MSKTDAELLDFLADPSQNIANVVLPIECLLRHPESLREAIAEAMRLHTTEQGQELTR